jgi:hypothetical protein
VISTEGGASRVSVLLSDCACEDALTVLRTLSGMYDSDRPVVDPSGSEGRNATVWSASYDVIGAGRRPEAAVLHGRVDAELQGPPHAVDRLADAMKGLFTVRAGRAASGDQEEELTLHLESR